MNLHFGWIVLAAAVIAPPVQEKTAIYAFVKGQATKYDTVGQLSISLKGSHKDFVEGGIEQPILMRYRVRFENVVVEAFEDGGARLERQVRTLHAEGMVSGNPFKYSWDRAKDLGKLARPDEGPDSVKGLFRTWCASPLAFVVSAEGRYTTSVENYDQLVNKAGVMYWVVKTGSTDWLTEEKIAAPLMHTKLVIEFKNQFSKTATVSGKKLMIIDAKPSLKSTIAAPAWAPRVIDGPVEYKVTGGGNVVEYDTTNRRLHSVKLDLTVQLSGTGTTSTGGKGDLRGEVKFSERQDYKD